MSPSKWRTAQMAQIRLIGATLICLFHRQIANFNDSCYTCTQIQLESLQNEQAEQQVGIAGLATKRERHPKGC